MHAIHLVEEAAPLFSFHSLRELLSAATDYAIFDGQGSQGQSVTISLPVEATLTGTESLSLDIGTDRFEVVEAAVVGSEVVKPPHAEASITT